MPASRSERGSESPPSRSSSGTIEADRSSVSLIGAQPRSSREKPIKSATGQGRKTYSRDATASRTRIPGVQMSMSHVTVQRRGQSSSFTSGSRSHGAAGACLRRSLERSLGIRVGHVLRCVLLEETCLSTHAPDSASSSNGRVAKVRRIAGRRRLISGRSPFGWIPMIHPERLPRGSDSFSKRLPFRIRADRLRSWLHFSASFCPRATQHRPAPVVAVVLPLGEAISATSSARPRRHLPPNTRHLRPLGERRRLTLQRRSLPAAGQFSASSRTLCRRCRPAKLHLPR